MTEFIRVDEIILKTTRDYRKLADKLDSLFTKLATMDYGTYVIDEEDRNIFVMAENMVFLQEALNKGIRVLGVVNTRKVEIYDYNAKVNRIERQMMILGDVLNGKKEEDYLFACYVSKSRREDVIAAMKEFISKHDLFKL